MKFPNLLKVSFLLIFCFLNAQVHAVSGITSSHRFDPAEEVEDMRVKVLGGYVRITRHWDAVSGRWVWNKRWEPITAIARSFTISLLPRVDILSMKRNNSHYTYTHVEDEQMIFENRSGNRISRASWYLEISGDLSWTDRQGNRADYQGSSTPPNIRDNPYHILSYQDKNNVKVSFVPVTLDVDNTTSIREISQIRDHHGNIIFMFEWEKTPGPAPHFYNIKSITDYTGRKVSYTYSGYRQLQTITDVGGNIWSYTYDNPPPNTIKKITSQMDPENRAVNYPSLNSISYANGSKITKTKDYDPKTELTHETEVHSSGKVIDTWINTLGEVVRRNINGELDFSAEFILSNKNLTPLKIAEFYNRTIPTGGYYTSYCDLIGGLTVRGLFGDSNVTRCTNLRADLVFPDCLASSCNTEFSHLLSVAKELDRTDPIILHQPGPINPPGYVKTKIVTDARGNKTIYDYDQWRNEVKVTYPDNTSTSRTWHKKFAFPLTETNEKGIVTSYDYDEKGNLLTLTEAKGLPEQRITRYTYDQYGQVETKTTGESLANHTALATTRYEYDQYGNTTKVTDPEGNVTKYSDFDVLGHARTVIDARATLLPQTEQNSWKYTYDAAGNLLTSLDPYGSGASYSYTKSGDLRTITTPGAGTVTLTTNGDGLPLTMTDANGKVTKLEFDTANQVTSITDESGNKTQYIYDDKGQLVRTIDAEKNTTQLTYEASLLKSIQFPTYKETMEYDQRDRLNRATQQANNRNYIRKHGFDVQGNNTSSTDAQENTTVYEYDALNRLVKMTDAISGVTQFTYDARDNLLQVNDPENRLTVYAYDRNNRLLSETKDGDQNTTRQRRYEYDANGNLINTINPEQEKTVNEYNKANRLLKSSVFANKNHAKPLKVIHYTLNAKSQLGGWSQDVSADLPEGIAPTPDIVPLAEAYTYTNLGQLESVVVNLGSFSKTYSYSYYPNGLKKTYTNPEGITYTYFYNKNNQLTAVHIPNNGQLSYGEFNWLMPQKLVLPGGQTLSYNYTDFLQVKERILRNTTQATLGSALYEYDMANNIQKIEAHDGEYKFTYDNLYRLKTTDVPVGNPANDEAFSYDGVGNRIALSTGSGETAATETLSYNQKNQLTAASADTTYTYTANGHTKTQTRNGVVTEYIYNHEERLIAVKRAGIVVGEYVYNPRGQRVKKTAGGNITWYLYNENGLAAEYNSAGNLIKEYQFHPQKTWMTNPLFMRTATSELYYYHNDHLGTPQQLISSNGVVVWQAQYSAFGKANIVVASVENNLRFAGQYFDLESGLHYNYFRDYDPSIGRYIESDPIGLSGGMNTYAYVEGNPLSRIDPSGLDCVALNGNVSCHVPGGPNINFPRPPEWPDTIKPGDDNYHYYNKQRTLPSGANSKCIQDYINKHPTPGVPSPATPSGTANNASPNWVPSILPSPVMSYSMFYNGSPVVVNVTIPGHPLFPGYVARTVSGGVINNFGEGSGFLQNPNMPGSDKFINDVWYGLSDEAIKACSCQ